MEQDKSPQWGPDQFLIEHRDRAEQLARADEAIATAVKSLFSTSEGIVVLDWLETFLTSPVYVPGMTHDETTFNAGQQALAVNILRLAGRLGK